MHNSSTEAPTKRFDVGSTMDGYEVIDNDGRAVTNSFEFSNQAFTIRNELNAAAAEGPEFLAVALGCIDNAFDPYE